MKTEYRGITIEISGPTIIQWKRDGWNEHTIMTEIMGMLDWVIAMNDRPENVEVK